MHPRRQRKFILLLCVVCAIGLATGLILYALRQNISLFYTPTEIKTGHSPASHRIRAGGMVVPGSIVRSKTDLSVQFKLTDYQETILVTYQGILPDLFREGQGVVVQGEWLPEQTFKAMSVLAKHDENYMPPEVKAALKTKRIV